MDPTKRHTRDTTETKQSFHLKELAKELDAPVERVRLWLEEEGVKPVSEEEPDVYGGDAAEVVRGRRQQI